MLMVGYPERRGDVIWRNSAGRGGLSPHLDSGGAQMSDSRCVRFSSSAALSAPVGEEQARASSSSVLSVRRRERKWSATGRFASQLALHCSWETQWSGTSGRLMAHCTESFSPRLMHRDADVDADDYPERNPQKGHW